MSFAERELRLTFSGAREGTISVSGLRAIANIEAVQGRLGVSGQVRVWGLSMAQMNAYSSRISTAIGSSAVGVNRFNLAIEAGDVGGMLSKVVDAPIWQSYVDLEGAPESAFNVTVAGIFQNANTITAQSQAGAQNAEDLIASICAAANLNFRNNGAHAVLRNHATYGSAIDQIEDIARAAGFAWSIIGNTVSIWPSSGQVDDTVIDVGPSTGMVGYPAWWEAGIIVRSLFNQDVQVGRQMKVTSSIPKANGLWSIVRVQHELATMLRDGPWFTVAVLSAPN